MIKDFLGQEIAPGDLVLYPALSGRSCQMVLARFIGGEAITQKVLDDFVSEVIRKGMRGYDHKTGTYWNAPASTDYVEQQIAAHHMVVGRLVRARVEGVSGSRWEQHGRYSPKKPVTLTANAASIVRSPVQG